MDFVEIRREVLNRIGVYDKTPYRSNFGLFVSNEEDKIKAKQLLENHDEFEAEYLPNDFVKVCKDEDEIISYSGKFAIHDLPKFEQILKDEGILYFFCGHNDDYERECISINDALRIYGEYNSTATKKLLTSEEILGIFILGKFDPDFFDSLPVEVFGEMEILNEEYNDEECLCWRTIYFKVHGIKIAQTGRGEGHNGTGYDDWVWDYDFDVV